MSEQTKPIKEWQYLSQDEQNEIMASLEKIYQEFGNPTWLQKPVVNFQVVTNLKEPEIKKITVLNIKGAAPIDKQQEVEVLTKQLKEATKTVDFCKIDISCSYAIGDKPGPITNVNKVMDDGKATVQHEPGQVILLDFWATWCPPCQAPMAHNQEMLDKRKDWDGKVRLVGLSIDTEESSVKTHVEKKGWTSVEHYQVRTEGCVADKEFGIRGVPHVALLDTEGKIVFKGHPAQRSNLEEDIDKLLAGGTITGRGTQVTEEAEGEDTSKSPSGEELDEAISKFENGAQGLLNNDALKETVNKCARAFVVLTDDAVFDFENKKFKHKLNFTMQVFGEKSNVKAIEDEVDKFSDGPWKINKYNRIR